jgi:hypothetical protein
MGMLWDNLSGDNPLPMNQTLLNKTPITVIHLDGKSETVSLRELSIRQLGEFITFLANGKSPHLVALCVDRPIEWIDTLTLASYGELCKKALAVNFPRAAEVAVNDPVAGAELLPLLHRLNEMVKLLPEELTSPPSTSH